jgi:hypothetical protein
MSWGKILSRKIGVMSGRIRQCWSAGHEERHI